MSGIYIKDIAVPKSGYVDVRIFHDGRATTQTGEHPFYREMDVLEIPPHGRMIDERDILKNQHDVILKNGAKHRCFDTTMLSEIQTIIPASEEGET